jgi:hypothetical protein
MIRTNPTENITIAANVSQPGRFNIASESE